MTITQAAPVAIIMGSQSDWPTMRHAAETLDALKIAHEARIVSAHRTPRPAVSTSPSGARRDGFKVIIAGAGGAAHLPGMIGGADHPAGARRAGAKPRRSSGQDSLLSIVQMPAGMPVGTLAIGEAGAINAALLAAADPGAQAMRHRAARSTTWRAEQTAAVAEAPKRRWPDAARRCRPASTIGILGGGQLGRMLALAAARLGIKCHIYCARSRQARPSRCDRRTRPSPPMTTRRRCAAFAAAVDVVTYEFENVPGPNRALSSTALKPLAPGAKALEIAQDRLAEKTFLAGLGIAGGALRAGRRRRPSLRRRSPRSAARRC